LVMAGLTGHATAQVAPEAKTRPPHKRMGDRKCRNDASWELQAAYIC